MELLKQLLPILLMVSIGLIVASLGISAGRGDMLYVLRSPERLARAFLAVLLIPLVTSLAIVYLFPISQPVKLGIILMALSPVAPVVPGKAQKFGSDSAFVTGIQVAAALSAIIWIPLAGTLLAKLFGINAEFPVAVLSKNIVVGIMAPLLVGVAIRHWVLHDDADKTAKVAKIVKGVANVLLIVAIIPILIAAWPNMMRLIGNGTVIAMALIVIIVLAGGHLLGGNTLRLRAALAFTSAMRHPGIALAIISANHADKAISGAVVLFLLVSVITLIPYQLFLRRHERELKSDAAA